MAHVHEKSFGETPMENGVFVLHLHVGFYEVPESRN